MIRHLINGEWVESEETFENFNPATGEVLGMVSAASEAQVNDAVQAAKKCVPGLGQYARQEALEAD